MTARIGRPPLQADERGRRVTLYLTAEAHAALLRLAAGGNKSEVVSSLLVSEAKRRGR